MKTARNKTKTHENNMETSKIRLPHDFTPRDYQLPVLKALDQGYRRAVCVWHRRSGKDKTFINYIAKAMYERVGGYYYFFPTYRQAKKVIWNGMDREGYKFTDHIPEAIRRRTDNTDMLIETKNGSIFQLIGTDEIDRIRGTNPVGCVFSEWPLQNPMAWDIVRPILAENDGWAAFTYTPLGKNHGYTLLETARAFPDSWYSEVLTVKDTNAIPSDVLTQERLEIIRKDGNDALYMQEYMCSFDVPIQGAYYAQQLMTADEEGRIAGVPYDPATQVHTFWDLGIDDSMTIWFMQVAGREFHFVDYYESSGEGINYYIKYLKEKPYVYGQHFAPHDIRVRELTTGKSRYETAKKLGIDFEIVPKLDLNDGIDAARNVLNRCWFDKVKCERGLSALRSYHKEWDEDNQVFKNKPKHDWSSHGCLSGDSLILTKTGKRRIDQVQVNDKVWTPCGYQKVLNAGITKVVNSILEIRTSRGTLRCTPEHKFFTNRGVVCADTLRYNDEIWTQDINLSKLFFKELPINFREDIMLLHQAEEKNTAIYIEQFGHFIMERFQKVITFIIKTGIVMITGLRILSVYLNTIISLMRQNLISGWGQKQTDNNCLLKQFPYQKYGIDQKKEGSGIANMVKKLGRIGNGELLSVLFVDKKRKLHIQLEQNIVAHVVKVRHVTSKQTPVYDLTIDKHHCYLANGLLVSNSDAFRTFAVGWKQQQEQQQATGREIIIDPYE